MPVQIVGEIKEAREAVLDVTSRLRSYVYRDFLQRDTVPPSAPFPGVDASSHNMATVAEPATTNQNVQSVAVALASKVLFCKVYLIFTITHLLFNCLAFMRFMGYF